MRFNKKKIKKLNDLLKEVKENREHVIELIVELCPKKVSDCDNQLELNREATKCEYFTLCNVMGSYSLMNKKEQKKINNYLDKIYSELEFRNNKFSDIYR